VIARAVLALAILWPALATAAVVSEAAGRPSAWTHAVYLVGSRVCHQRPERSFHLAGVAWPVCARCSGLYLGAAAGGWLGLAAWAPRARRHARWMLVVAAAPTAATWLAESILDAPVTTGARLFAALPLGAALAATIVFTAAERPAPIR
jgi:uncharacterized membrane protein